MLMRPRAKKILVVDDQEKIVNVVKAYLEREGYAVIAAYDGEAALSAYRADTPDLIILDLMLPKISGEEILMEVRRHARTPIIMLTAKAHEAAKIEALRLGADDYLTKPFSPGELVARVATILRRCADEPAPVFEKLHWHAGDLEIDMHAASVKKRGVPVRLTPNEYKVLTVLLSRPRKTFTRDELIASAFGCDYDGFDRTVDSHIKNLRAKIEDDTANPVYILTMRGFGYRFGGSA